MNSQSTPVWLKLLLAISCIILAPILFLLTVCLFICAFVCLTITALNIFHVEVSLIIEQLAFLEALPKAYTIIGSLLAIALAVISYQLMGAYLSFCGRKIRKNAALSDEDYEADYEDADFEDTDFEDTDWEDGETETISSFTPEIPVSPGGSEITSEIPAAPAGSVVLPAVPVPPVVDKQAGETGAAMADTAVTSSAAKTPFAPPAEDTAAPAAAPATQVSPDATAANAAAAKSVSPAFHVTIPDDEAPAGHDAPVGPNTPQTDPEPGAKIGD